MTPNTRRALYPLSYENLESKVIKLSSYVTRVLHTASISTVEVIVGSERTPKHHLYFT